MDDFGKTVTASEFGRLIERNIEVLSRNREIGEDVR